MTYAIIKVAGKQYRVREGERLLVDRIAEADGATFSPTVLLVGGDGSPVLEPSDIKVMAKVLGPRERPQDPHREVQEAHRLPPAHRLSFLAHADRDRVHRRQEARVRRKADGRDSSRRGGPSSRRSA